MKKVHPHIAIAAGGTGGHISPAIALTESFFEKNVKITFITLEKNRDYPPYSDLKGKAEFLYYRAPNIPNSVKTLMVFFREIFYSYGLLKTMKSKNKIDALIAFGGYPVFPALLWAWFNKIPIFLHEQNSVSGLITRLFARKAKFLIHSFPRNDYKRNEIFLGNPLRNIFIKQKIQPKKLPKTIRKILITGGSQGAKDLNDLYLKLAEDPFFKNVHFTVSTGPGNFKEISSHARKSDRVFPFIKDMDREILGSDLVFCRSGSGSVYEAIWSGKPVIFFPYPYATDNHQAKNAIAASDDRFYYTLDIRPFDPQDAVNKIKKIILNMESEKGKPVSRLPLDAHKTLADLVLENI